MIIENKEYKDIENEIDKLKNELEIKIDKLKEKLKEIKHKELDKVLNFGKHNGQTIREILQEDKQYICWLIKKTQFEIDPKTIGFKLPTKEDILDIVKNDFWDAEFVEEGIKVINRIHRDAEYDNWNVGHYGCTEPELVSPGYTKYEETIYNAERLYKRYLEELTIKFPYIPWTLDYFKNIMQN